MITMNSLANIFHTEHLDGEKADGQSILNHWHITKIQVRCYQTYPYAKLMNVVDTQKVHNDYEFTKPEDILPNKISQRTQLQNHLFIINSKSNKNCE